MNRTLKVLIAVGLLVLCDVVEAQAMSDDEALSTVFRRSVEELSLARPKTICLSSTNAYWAARTVEGGEFALVHEPRACPAVAISSHQTEYVRLWFGDVVHTSPGDVTITRRVYRNPLDAEERVFSLRFEGGRWSVVKEVQIWIS